MIYYQEPHSTLLQGHVLSVLRELPNESVDMVMTSPPFWGLRTYKTEPQIWGDNDCEHEWENRNIVLGNNRNFVDREGRGSNNPAIGGMSGFCLKCQAWKGELGLEPMIELYISHLIQIFTEIKRVLKKTGTLWVNIGDSYAGGGRASGQSREQVTDKQATNFESAHINIKIDYPAKSLCLIPFRFAIGMVEQGWILRNTIIWVKPNPMPESVKDRFTEDFEYLFFFSKSKHYFFEQQFEPNLEASIKRYDYPLENCQIPQGGGYPNEKRDAPYNWNLNPLGRNKRCVWNISTESSQAIGGIKNFATYPEKLCEIPILAGCPQNGTVLDPFVGSGTTLAVAKRLGRKSIGIELNIDYCKLAQERVSRVSLPMELE